jgi:hypothetical protein
MLNYDEIFEDLRDEEKAGTLPEKALRQILEDISQPYNHDAETLSDACGISHEEMSSIINDLPSEEYPSSSNSEVCELIEKLYLRHGRVGLAAASGIVYRLFMTAKINEKVGSELKKHLSKLLKSDVEDSDKSSDDPIKGIDEILGKFFS